MTRQLAEVAGDDLAMGRNFDKPLPPTVSKICVTGVLMTRVSQIEQATADLLVGNRTLNLKSCENEARLYKNELRESNNCNFVLKNERTYVSVFFHFL